MLIKLTVDEYIVHSLARMLITITIVQVGLLIIESALRFYFSFATAWLGQYVVKDLRVNVYKKILGQRLSFFDKTPIGTLTTRTINDVEAINDIFAEGLVPILADLLSIVCILTYMFWVDWQLAFISLIPFPILIIGTYYFKESINKSFFKVRNAVAKLNAFVQEHLSGMQVVQAFAVEQKEMGRFEKLNRLHRHANIKAIWAYSLFFPLVEIIMALSIAGVIWYSSHQAFTLRAGQEGLIVSFILCINLLFRPLRMIADKFNVLQMGVIAAERVFILLDSTETEVEKKSIAPTANEGRFAGKVTFTKVNFSYNPQGPQVLHNLSFTIEPGETVAIVGATGSGKTTIISLLGKLYPITHGIITVDDMDINNLNLATIRSNIGYVLQDVFLFSGSIMDNCTLHNPAISEERVIAAARLIGLHDFIMQLPGGYHYKVSERGASLSLGQRQLISFMRALLYNPSILILDEATSSIDPESERLIENAIQAIIKGRTSIVIAHRLSTIRKAHKIIVLHKGVLVEMGTHNQLLQQGGYYAQLDHTQYEKYEPKS